MHNIARSDGVHVAVELCATCIFRPGNLMHLKAGRVREMVDEATKNDGVIVCHSTLDLTEHMVCRGFYDRYADRVWPLRLAAATDHIIFDPPPTKGT